jgi:hypothetical protein
VIHLLGALARLAEHARTPEQAAALRRHAALAAAAGLRQAEEPSDRADIEAARAEAERKLRRFAGATADEAGAGAAEPDRRVAAPAAPFPVAAAGHAAKRVPVDGL